MRKISVGDVMTRNFVSAKPDSSLYECAKLMAKERVNSLVITEGRRLIGIITARDILWVLTKKQNIDLSKIRSIDVAARKLAVIKPSADINQAIKKMQESNFRRLPVISRGEIIGMITLKDISSIEPQLYGEISFLIDNVREREQKKTQTEADWPLEGLCENCGAFADLLKVEKQLLCPDCRDELY